MALDANGDWDGICACGKAAMDGVKCHFGATHLPKFADQMTPEDWAALKPQQLMPWETSSTPAVAVVPSSTSQPSSRPLFPWCGTTGTEVL